MCIELVSNERRYSDVFPLGNSRISLVTQKLGCHTDWHLPGQKLRTCRRRTQSTSMSTARSSGRVVMLTSTCPQVCELYAAAVHLPLRATEELRVWFIVKLITDFVKGTMRARGIISGLKYDPARTIQSPGNVSPNALIPIGTNLFFRSKDDSCKTSRLKDVPSHMYHNWITLYALSPSIFGVCICCAALW